MEDSNPEGPSPAAQPQQANSPSARSAAAAGWRAVHPVLIRRVWPSCEKVVGVDQWHAKSCLFCQLPTHTESALRQPSLMHCAPRESLTKRVSTTERQSVSEQVALSTKMAHIAWACVATH